MRSSKNLASEIETMIENPPPVRKGKFRLDPEAEKGLSKIGRRIFRCGVKDMVHDKNMHQPTIRYFQARKARLKRLKKKRHRKCKKTVDLKL